MTIMNASNSKCQMSFIMATQVSPGYETFRKFLRGLSESYVSSVLDHTHQPRNRKSGNIKGSKITRFLHRVVIVSLLKYTLNPGALTLPSLARCLPNQAISEYQLSAAGLSFSTTQNHLQQNSHMESERNV